MPSVPSSATQVLEGQQNAAPQSRAEARASSEVATEQNNAESSTAVRNAASLGSSLLITTAIGFVVQIVATNIIKTDANGRAGAAEALAGIIFGLFSLGIDFYVRKEVAVRPEHAKQFVPGSLLLRAVLLVPMTLAVAFGLHTFNRSSEFVAIFMVFAIGRYLAQTNDVLSACLHAVSDVKGLPRQNMLSKIVASATVLGVAITLRRNGAIAVPLGILAGEIVKLVFLVPRVGRRLDLWSQPRNQSELKPALRSSLPFLTIIIVTSFANYIDITLMGFLLPEAEVGLYKRAQQLTLLAFIAGTVMPWVILPMASRAVSRSRKEFAIVMKRSTELILLLAIPLGAFLALHADTVLELTGRDYLKATNALRIMSVLIIVTYLSMIMNTFLQAEGRTWVGVRAGIAVVVVDTLLVLLGVRRGYQHFGDGGAGTVASFALLIAETIGAVILVMDVGPQAWDMRSVRSLVRMLLVFVPVVIIDFVMRSVSTNFPRLIVDLIVFGANVALLKVINVGQVKSLLRGTVPEEV
jgi:O-antigen/teichoic acid export membrane protein